MDESTFYRDHWVTIEPERLEVSDHRTPRRAHSRQPREPGPLKEPWQNVRAAQSQLSAKGHLIVARQSCHYT